MRGKGHSENGGEWSQERPHQEFLQLCSLAPTGELTSEEQRRLQEHLAACSACRRALAEFEAVGDLGVPLLATELAEPDSFGKTSESDRIGAPIAAPASLTVTATRAANQAGQDGKLIAAQRDRSLRSDMNWRFVWVPLAAAVVLIAALGIYTYQIGKSQGRELNRGRADGDDARVEALEKQMSDAGHERETLTAQLTERDRIIRELRRQIDYESAALSDAKSVQANLERNLQVEQSEKGQAAQQETAIRQTLDAAEVTLEKTQAELDSERHDREQDRFRAESLEGQIKDLNLQLRLREETLSKEEDLLADDRDVRELMGARDLYIAEVYDVAKDGATQKPYGRVFYTKGKSLVFYAYDLDQQPGVKDASTFQAWGQSGPDRQQALNLGIFYEDSQSRKRWILRFDDPRMLEQINAVFVTVEPHGGSHKPSGKPLLFASLRIEPNHP